MGKETWFLAGCCLSVPSVPRGAGLARLRLLRTSLSDRPCNNAAKIGKRVKPSESVWPECKRVLESSSFLRCEISIYIV